MDTFSNTSKIVTISGSEASHFMGDYVNPRGPTRPMHGTPPPVRELRFDIKLLDVRTNVHGAKLFIDPANRIAARMKDILSPLEAKVWINYQSDLYMSIGGIRYVLAPSFEHMDSLGRIHEHEGCKSFHGT